MNFLSLFSGIGGFELGLTRAGMNCVGMCEIAQKAKKVLQKHFLGIPLYHDVRELNHETFKDIPIDLICGGFPCQDISIVGKRQGLAGRRSRLWFEFERLIDELRPRWVFGENVANLLHVNRGRDWFTILQALEKRGYGVAWRIFDSQFFGVPQVRRRLFFLASYGNLLAARALFEGELTPENFEEAETREKDIQNFEKAQLNMNTPIVISHVYWYSNAYIDKIPTLLTKDDFVVVHNGAFRRLTISEMEQAQGFPVGWTDGVGRHASVRLLGNAVTVNVIEWIGKRIMYCDQFFQTRKEECHDSY